MKVKKQKNIFPLVGKIVRVVSVCVADFPIPYPLTVTQALKCMMDLEDDSDWSLSDEPEDKDSTR